jgi:hypothetical protein
LFVLLVLGHLVADYPLQTDFVAKFKCRRASLPSVPWYYVMAGHAATHAVSVWLITGSVWLGCAEFVAHYVIDVLKCEGLTNIHVDQSLHVACKVAWLMILVLMPS